MKIDASHLAAVLVSQYGLDIRARNITDPSGNSIVFFLEELHQNEGFQVTVRLGWRSIDVSLDFGTYAADLIAEMGKADLSKKMAFVSLAQILMESGGEFRMYVNGIPVRPDMVEDWPEQWTQLALLLRRVPLMIEPENTSQTEKQILFWGGGLFGMVFSLLPIEDAEIDSEKGISGLPEGAKERAEVNRYERNRLNRALCITIQGTVCKVCGFDFESFYGDMGAGFIHVHHIVPVSKMGEGYIVNPAKDLVPVCPNCHAIIHRVDPPMCAEELKNILVQRNSIL